MNMENKYFTPDIEDFYVGYEFETKMYGEDDTWVKCIYSKPTDELFCKDSDDNIWVNDSLRVPYLTKEQIEAEGWKQEFVYPQGASIMIFGKLNKGYELMLPAEDHYIVITKVWTLFDDQVKRDDIFKGECKDINTFRKITKLLKIN
jgi:hypothetical protein